MTEDSQPKTRTPSVSDFFKLLSCCMTGAGYHHDINPWSDSDLKLQAFSTAALEALQEHAMHQMEPFLHMNQVLNKEIASRKLDSRSANSSVSESSNKPREVLFDIKDFGCPMLLGGQDNISAAVCGQSESEHRDVIAKMSLAWVSATRETSRLYRDGVRRTSVKHRNANEVASVIDIEGAEPGAILFEDVEGLEDEMESYT